MDVGQVRVSEHRGYDDLLSAGLGLTGLAGPAAPFSDPFQPTSVELRRRAIQSSWKAIADLGPLGGYGTIYGGVPHIPGREYQAFVRLAGARSPHRVLAQLPDHFDPGKPCLLLAPSSGSRGVYGAIALAGAWGLPRGCAVAYTDKGGGGGYFDHADDSGVALDGRRAMRGVAELEFEPPSASGDAGIAVKHAHSGDNPEADWGQHVLQAARFGLAMLDRAFPAQAPFTPRNTRIIATGLSNGGAAVLQAAGLDNRGLLDGVVALEPNVHVPGHGRALYDYATEAAILAPCALADARFCLTPLARGPDGSPLQAGLWRGASLHARGALASGTRSAQAAEAYEILRHAGWTDEALQASASTAAFDMWQAIAVAYASAYLRRGATAMPLGYRYAAMTAAGLPGLADPVVRAAWWPDAAGIPPGHGVGLYGPPAAGADPVLAGLEGLRALWTGDDGEARALRQSVAATCAGLPHADLPIWVVHGSADGLLPTAFSSEPYVQWLRAEGCSPVYWKVPHAQHFDAFLALPGFGDRHVPLLPYAYAALDGMWAHLQDGVPLPMDAPAPAARPRGERPLDRADLGLS